MAPTPVASRGSSVVTTVAGGGTWASTTNAFDGSVGTNPATYTTWTSTTRSDVGSVTIGGYFGTGTLTTTSAITGASIAVRHFESSTTVVSALTAQLQDSTGTSIGTAQTVSRSTTAVTTTVTPDVLPTVAQINAGLRLLVTVTSSNSTTSRTLNLDQADITVNWTDNVLAQPAGASLSTSRGTPLVTVSTSVINGVTASVSLTGGTPVVVARTRATVATLVDDFSTQDTGKWSGYSAPNVIATGGQLQLSPLSGGTVGPNSVTTYDLRNSSIYIKFVSYANPGTSWFAALILGVGADQESMVAAGAPSTLYFRELIGGIYNQTSITFDTVAHAYWRISQSGTSVLWDTSPDGITWTNQRTKTQGAIDLSSVTVYVQVNTSDSSTAVAKFDNLNTPPVVVSPGGAAAAVTGGTPGVAVSSGAAVTVSPTGGSLSVTGGTALVAAAYTATPTGGSLAASPGTALVAAPYTAAPVAGSLAATGGTGLVTAQYTVTPTGASLGVTAGTPILAAGLRPTGATAAVTVGTPLAATPVQVAPLGATLTASAGTPLVAVSSQVQVAPGGGALSLAGGTPPVTAPYTVTPGGASLSVTGGTPAVATPVTVTPTAAGLSVTPSTPLVAAAYTAVPSTGTLSLTAGTPPVATPYTVKPGTASPSITSGTPLVAAAYTVKPTAASASLTGGTPIVIARSHPAVEIFTDDFSTQNITKWTGYSAPYVLATGGQLQLEPLSGGTVGPQSAITYDLTGSAIFCEFTGYANPGSSYYAGLILAVGSDQESMIFAGSPNTLYFRELIGGVYSDTSTTFDATAHKWWRIREAAGHILWDTSPDGVTWTNRRDKVKGAINVTSVTVYLLFYTADSSTAVANFDNVNVAPTAAITAAPSPAGAAPISGVLAKLAGNLNATMQIVGDSTARGEYDADWSTNFGWPGRLAVLLGETYGATVIVKPLNYPTDFTYLSPVTIYTAPGASPPTLTVMLGGWSGAVDATYIANLAAIIPGAVDAVIIADGFNETSTTGFTADYATLIGDVQARCPGVPIFVTTENATTATGESGHPTFAALFAAMITEFLPGQSLPLSPALQRSTTFSGVWVLDTQQAGLISTDLAADGLHPVGGGYAKQASWMVSPLTSGLTLLTGGTPTVTVTAPTVIQPGAATLTTTTSAPPVATPVNARPAAGALTITTGRPVAAVGLLPIGAALSVTGGTPLVAAAYIVKPTGAVLTSTRGSPSVRTSAPGGKAITHGGKLLVLGGRIVLLPA